MTWKKLIELWQKAVKPQVSETAINGIKTIQELLPDLENDHPLLLYLLNLAPWNAENISFTADVISSFKNERNFKSILTTTN